MKHLIKYLLWLTVAVLLISSFAACSDKNDEQKNNSSTSSSLTVSTDNSLENNDPDGGSSNNNTSSKTDTGNQNSSSTSSSSTESAAVSSKTEPEPENAPTVFLDAEKDGDTVTVTASVRNNSGLAGFGIKISYEQAKVTPVEIKKGLVTVVSNLQQSTKCNGAVTAVYSDAAGFCDNGVLFTVAFKITDPSAAGATFKILAESNSFVDRDAKYTTFATADTTIGF